MGLFFVGARNVARQPYEQKALAFEGIGFDEVEGTIEGIAAVYGNWDRANERIEDGACAKSIRERGHKIPMGLDHLHGFGLTVGLQELTRQELPAAIRSEYPDATGGLGCKGQVVLSDENIRRLGQIRQKADAGQPVGMSITYRVLRDSPGQTPTGAKGRHLHELALHEWGPQLSLRPVNPAAMVLEAKGAKGWDMSIPGSDEERRGRLAQALRASGLLGLDLAIQAVLPDSVIAATYGPDGERTYSVAYVEDAATGGYAFSPPVEVDIRPMVVEKAEQAAALEAIVADAAARMKAGAVLSSRNLELVDRAIEALTALRAAAMPESAEGTEGKADAAPEAAPAAPVAMPRTDLAARLRLSLAAIESASYRAALLPRTV